jgi:CRP-like cAMP-binding protein
MDHAQAVFFHSVDLFAGLSPSELNQILPRFHLQTQIRGDLLFLEGDVVQTFYIIIVGRVRLFETSMDGKEQTLFFLKARDFFDVVGLIDNALHPISAEAMTDLRLYVISASEMLDLLHQFPSISSTLLPHMCTMMHQLTVLVEDLSFKGVATRLVRLILLQAEDEGVTTPQGILLPWEFSHREIAKIIGTAREVVTRILNSMEQSGLIESTRGELLVEDLQKLAQYQFSSNQGSHSKK